MDSAALTLSWLDVFTDRPLGGNPLAVVPDADELSDGQMQALGRELGLSETIFVHAAADLHAGRGAAAGGAPGGGKPQRGLTPMRVLLLFEGALAPGRAGLRLAQPAAAAGSPASAPGSNAGAAPAHTTWSRPGPTPISVTGTPTAFAM